MTGLGFQGREAYLDVADEMGWFAEVGLQVEVVPGDGTGTNLELLAAGRVDFATLDVSAALIEYSRGTHTDFRLVSILHELNLSCVMVLASSDITSLHDLEGATVAVIPGGVNTVVFPALAEQVGFDPDLVELVPLAPPNPQTFGVALASGRVDAVMQFVVGQQAIETFARQPVRLFPYSDWIIDVYGSGIGVSAELAGTDPDLVRRFNTAAIRGLRWAVEHPVEAGAIFAQRHPELSAETAAAELVALQPYVRPSWEAAGPLAQGEVSEVRLAQNMALLEALGEVEAGITAQDVAVFGLVGAG
ncbi:MAG: ABC transporter substrate-binding protein [Natronosporangium sp.]